MHVEYRGTDPNFNVGTVLPHLKDARGPATYSIFAELSFSKFLKV